MTTPIAPNDRFAPLILTGPTASGKSALALELAERMDAEIVCADSMTLYRGMDIGTAKPSPAEQMRIPHHLLDVLDPWESAAVAWWLERAEAAFAEIRSRGKVPLVVGGTPFYLKALLCGIFPAPPADQALRRHLEAEALLQGAESIHRRLREVDADSADRLHPNDLVRVVRALEVYELTGVPLSVQQSQQWWGTDRPRFAPGQCLAIDMPRPQLYDRINQRVTAMFDAGWVDEVRRLDAGPRMPSREAEKALGYRQIREFLAGRVTLQAAIEETRLKTRQFAKRQMTWFRGLPGCELVGVEDVWQRWKGGIKS